MKLLSLFDGSGGFPLAASMCGISPIMAAEIEPYPIAVTRSRFPTMKHLGNVAKVKGNEIEPVDVITFGSPCQDLSVAGQRKGLKHEGNGDDETTRSGLFMEAIRIIKEMREKTNGKYPRYAIWENVPGAFSSNKGEDFRTVLEEFIKINEKNAVMPSVPKAGWAYADCYSGNGWSIAYRVFDAQYWGVPQRRRRIYLVADFTGDRAGKILFEREGVRGYFAQGRTPWKGIAAYAESGTRADDRTAASKLVLDGKAAYTLKIRSGCEGGGKGALVQEEKSATLATNNDQYLFQPVTFEPGIASRDGGHVYEGIAGTLRAAPGDNRLAVVVKEQHLFENHATDARYKGPLKVSPLLAARLGTGGNNVPLVVEKENPVYCLQGNGIDRADTAGCNGKGWRKDKGYTLNTVDRPAVVYGTDVGFLNSMEGKTPALLSRSYKDPHIVTYQENVGALCARDYKGVGSQYVGEDKLVVHQKSINYIVRRLTPTECARLQGFPDKWGHPDKKESFTDEEYQFWLDVRNTHAEINGKTVKEYTKAQILTWYNKLHTDSSEYKMWGNGIALPNALYVMQGIAAEERKNEVVEE